MTMTHLLFLATQYLTSASHCHLGSSNSKGDRRFSSATTMRKPPLVFTSFFPSEGCMTKNQLKRQLKTNEQFTTTQLTILRLRLITPIQIQTLIFNKSTIRPRFRTYCQQLSSSNGKMFRCCNVGLYIIC